ncbi:MAG: SURF1 family protein [Roseateles sp.]|nr:MAG: SURF1 family protein [Roseateles sp.]
MKQTARIAWVSAALLAMAGFAALGIWQIERLAWKRELIARVERQMQAPPQSPPEPARWAGLAKPDEYRRLRLQGRFEPGEVFVQASTELGGGFWVLAPLRLDDGAVVLVNRGFVPPERRAADQHQAVGDGPVQLTGLLRLSEPHGGVLRENEPQQDRWYSRDVGAIAARLGLRGPVAPFFVDEVADSSQPQRWPRPGLTVLRFSNNHAVYAATWFALAAMVAAAAGYLLFEERRRRAGAGAATLES